MDGEGIVTHLGKMGGIAICAAQDYNFFAPQHARRKQGRAIAIMDKLISPAQSLAFSASYTAVLIFLGLVLTYRVIFVRRSARISLGDGENKELRKRIRAHGNFAEQAPWLALVLMVLPFLGAREWMIHLVGATGVTGRILHALAVSKGDALLRYRALGMVLTTLAQAIGGLALLVLAWS